ncbi:hypothetical protein [Mycoplasmopsis cynos]|uniref:hypothetical protein n=1 Tax=Mycoplasmopsis cynos TaxID=171284 RepID=UPI0021FEB011|nr:hypothetical protein [Mycoplasmopsis cynos]UWV77862.1 hypothetical protein NW070_03185 [Mycoplasmopsis cynos]UWV92568.1 hypothetical protein NWE57_00295 [Mycoplasmopsis cynos]
MCKWKKVFSALGVISSVTLFGSLISCGESNKSDSSNKPNPPLSTPDESDNKKDEGKKETPIPPTNNNNNNNNKDGNNISNDMSKPPVTSENNNSMLLMRHLHLMIILQMMQTRVHTLFLQNNLISRMMLVIIKILQCLIIMIHLANQNHL